MCVYRPVSWWVEAGDPKVFLGVTGELSQESVQPRSRNVVQGMRLVPAVLKLVICNVQPAMESLIPLFACAMLSGALKCFLSASP